VRGGHCGPGVRLPCPCRPSFCTQVRPEPLLGGSGGQAPASACALAPHSPLPLPSSAVRGSRPGDTPVVHGDPEGVGSPTLGHLDRLPGAERVGLDDVHRREDPGPLGMPKVIPQPGADSAAAVGLTQLPQPAVGIDRQVQVGQPPVQHRECLLPPARLQAVRSGPAAAPQVSTIRSPGLLLPAIRRGCVVWRGHGDARGRVLRSWTPAAP